MSTETADATAAEHVDTPWRRLNPRMIVVRPLHDAVGLIPVLVLYLVVGRGDTMKLVYSAIAIGALLVFGLAHWALTRYRITDQQVQLHTGLISRKQLAVRTERIRTVETTAKFGHRMFGLTALRIGTGQHVKDHEDELKLDAVTAAEAQRLQRLLLSRAGQPAAGTGESTVDSAPAAETELATMRRSWLRYAPLTLTGLATVAAAVGLLFRALNELEISPSSVGVVRWGLDAAQHTATLVLVLVVLAAILLVVGVGGLLGYILQFWNYRLTREPDGSLRVRRGMVTARSVSIDDDKLRGVRTREPLLLRLAAGARTDVISTGMSHSRRDESSLLVPPAPRAESAAIAATVLGTGSESPTTAVLRRHPAAALRRRLVRALGGAVVVVLAVAVTGWLGWLPGWATLVALVTLPVAGWLGVDRYRSLGHAVTGRYLVARSGSLPRDTAALQCTGIIGWTVRSSLFQRRSGLVTLTATTAAGSGAYHITDVAAAEGLATADAATPGLLTPFLAQGGYPQHRERPAGVDRL